MCNNYYYYYWKSIPQLDCQRRFDDVGRSVSLSHDFVESDIYHNLTPRSTSILGARPVIRDRLYVIWERSICIN
jgi:hypothetical protein